jgi:hypothetical protein
MMKKLKLEFEVLVDEAYESKLIEAARRIYNDRGGATEVLNDGNSRPIPDTEFIAGTPAAVIQLLECSPLIENSGVEFRDTSWTDLGYEEPEQPASETVEVEEEEETEVDLEAFETGCYLYRWPNGECSIVRAENRNDAVFLLDEWDDADPLALEPIEHCMIDFTLTDTGDLELNAFGGETHNTIWDLCYPELGRVLMRADRNTEAGLATVRRAVEYERTRLLEDAPAAG